MLVPMPGGRPGSTEEGTWKLYNNPPGGGDPEVPSVADCTPSRSQARVFVSCLTWSSDNGTRRQDEALGGPRDVTLSNYTSVHSGSCPPAAQVTKRSTFRPMGTTHQTYQVFLPCHN